MQSNKEIMIIKKIMKNVMMSMKLYNALTFFMMQKTEVIILKRLYFNESLNQKQVKEAWREFC